jgi:integrase
MKMAVMIECRFCKRKQSLKNRFCNQCHESLAQQRASGKVKFYIAYMLQGKIIWEPVVDEQGKPLGIDAAKAADGKRRGQRKEKRLTILDVKPELNKTFSQLAAWYLEQKAIKEKKYYPMLKINLTKFNQKFGDTHAEKIKAVDVENYRAERLAARKKPATVDQEVAAARVMVNAAFLNGEVSGESLKAFKVKNLCKAGSNARNRILTSEEFEGLYEKAKGYLRSLLAIGFFTGMRQGEILNLTWDKVSLPERLIRLTAEDTKTKMPREIPICDTLLKEFERIPRPIHEAAQNHVILYEGEPIRYVWGAIETLCKHSNIAYGRFVLGGFIFHDLRHTFIHGMRKAGVHDFITNAITGHSSNNMRDRYDVVDREDLKSAITAYEKWHLENSLRKPLRISSQD